MPNEMETFVRQLPRDTEIVALFKRISDECMIARPGPAIAPQG
jgi:Tfp pilus assembly protein PilO